MVEKGFSEFEISQMNLDISISVMKIVSKVILEIIKQHSNPGNTNSGYKNPECIKILLVRTFLIDLRCHVCNQF